MIKKRSIPTILAILVLAIAVIAGTFALSSTTIFKLGASPDYSPENVKVTNISDTSLTISWTTQKSVVGYVLYGATASLGQNTQADPQTSFVHLVNITNLNPGTSYFFKINSNGTLYDNSGIPWNANTAPTLINLPTAQVISGTITPSQSDLYVLVYVTPQGGSILSTLTDSSGNWHLTISSDRTSDLSSFVTLTPQTNLQIFAQGATSIASAQALLQGANPLPTMTMGQTYDFRNQSSTTTDTNSPSANISLPDNTASNSPSFNLPSSSASAVVSTVTVDSVKEGETISTTNPEFFGKGPVNTKLTITVHSQVATGSATTNSQGAWVWDPPANLDPGNHTLTITWKDAAGVLQSITRDFTVEASGLPSFVSTPSATPTPSPTATPSSRHSLPATTSGIPVSGDAIPTLIISFAALALLSVSIFIWKFSI